MVTVVVKWFNETKGFGFIAPDNGSKDAFAHPPAIKHKGSRTLKDGQKVTYDVENGPKGPQAINVQV